jgi:hypothetical protein
MRNFPCGSGSVVMVDYSMKTILVILAAAVVGMLAGCSTTPTELREPVGPDPFADRSADHDGVLRVFTATDEENDVGFQTPYGQRTDYAIYDWNGRLLTHVRDNNKGHFDGTPRAMHLPPGIYRIRALAAVGLGEWISVPVVIESGRTTDVHLNGHWRPPADSPETALVHAPEGSPIGWRATSLPNG